MSIRNLNVVLVNEETNLYIYIYKTPFMKVSFSKLSYVHLLKGTN